MIFSARRKHYALLYCCGLVSAVAGTYASDVLAQAPAPLRVDPVLLGLPPLKPAEAPAPAAAAPAPAAAAKEAPGVEVKSIEAPVVESRPVDAAPVSQPAKAGSTASGITAPPPEPTPAAAITPPASAPQLPTPPIQPTTPTAPTAPTAPVPAAAANPASVPAAATPPAPARQAAPASAVGPATAVPAKASAQPAAPVAPVPTASASAGNVSSLAPLRVDPALLGLPPPTVSASATSVAGSRPAQAGTPAGAPAPGAPVVLAAASTGSPAAAGKSWYRYVWDPLADAYKFGTYEFYLPLVTYHLRSAYTSEQIADYQERPPGFGVGKGYYNERGNWEGIYAMGFQDSHFKPSYIAGYGWKAMWRPADDVRVGLGYTAGLMTRADIGHYVPFPVILPMASLAYKNLSLESTYVPGGAGFGNIFFIWAKWEIGKTGEAIGMPKPPAPPPPVPTQMANIAFGAATPLAQQRVPYGPALEPGARLATATETLPPQVPATGPRDEEEVPDALPALALRASKSMEPPPKDKTTPQPVFLRAQRMAGEVDREFIAEGDAELRKIGTVLNSERLTYWPIDDEVEAEGNVHLAQGGDLITGPKMRLRLEDEIGYFEQPAYTLKRQPQAGSKAAADKAFAESPAGQIGDKDWFNSGFATPRVLNIKPGQTTFNETPKRHTATEGRGEADRIDFEGQNQVRLTNATYTTCSPGNDDWYAKAGDLKLDYDRGVGEGKDGTIYFKDVPILYSPWLSFSLNNERKSGFLAPSLGTNSVNGIEMRQPYYWNIAPNMDATIAPREMSKRGVEVGSEFRYLNTAYGGVYRGVAAAEVLPNDNLRDGDKRYALALQHLQTTASGFSGLINYNKVSDDNYFTDLSSNITQTSQVNLTQQALLSYGAGWWDATVNVLSYQTLQPDPTVTNLNPYRTLPQITVNARKYDLAMTDAVFMGQYTNFTKPDQIISGVKVSNPDGQRTVLYPQVSLPHVTPGWYVTPKLGVNVRNYSLTGQTLGTPASQNITLPVASLDSGMTFERSSNWFGKDYTQTLEPRLYYLNIPYKNQDQIPIFDTAAADFNFAQIFSENQYTGWDRISNANQLTAAATTRLLEPSSGNEIMRAMLGERFYFTRNKVLLPNTLTTTDTQKWEKSDALAAFSGQILPRIYADVALEYNLADRQLKRYSVGTRFEPEPGKVLNAAYRYNRDPTTPVDQVDVSGQWPIAGRWHAVGRVNYSFKDDTANVSIGSTGGRMIESIAGLEYNGGCWVVRGVVRRTALTQDTASTAFFIQLELNDFSSIGTNPLNILKRNIQGYSPINQPTADPVFGD